MRKLLSILLTPTTFILINGCTATQQKALGLWGPEYQTGTSGEKLNEKQISQRALDSVREKWGILLDIVTPMVEHDVIKDPKALWVIRQTTLEVQKMIPDAQSKLDGGDTISADYLVDKIAAAVNSVTKIKDKNKTN